MDRRHSIIKILALGLSSLVFGDARASVQPLRVEAGRREDGPRKIYLFSKVLQWKGYRELPGVVKELGFDGVDLTVRKSGHIEPSNAKKQLPEFVRICRDEGLQMPILTTQILDATEQWALDILETAGHLGIRHYRMGWYDYDYTRDLATHLKEHRSKVEKLSVLNERFQISGNYQNHAGNGVGAAVWDASQLMSGGVTGYSGIEYDIRHAMVEGAFSWPVSFEQIKEKIRVVDIKDFTWSCDNQSPEPLNVPLGKGMVDFKAFFALLNRNEIHTPLSIHVEHDLGGAEKGSKSPSVPENEILKAIKDDLQFLKKIA